MKYIFFMSLLIVSCGNPHIALKEPPQSMVSPIKPEDESGSCAEEQQQQQQQQQQQGDFVLIQDEVVMKLQKCKDNEVTLEKGLNTFTWKFDRPKSLWGVRMPLHEKVTMNLYSCQDELLKRFELDGSEIYIGYAAKTEDVCSVTLVK